MAASPGSYAGSEGSRSSSLAPIEAITDERDFNPFEDIIPDSGPQGFADQDSVDPNPAFQDAGIEGSFIPDSIGSNARAAGLPQSKEPTLNMEDISDGFAWSDQKRCSQGQNHQSCEAPAPSASGPPPRSSTQTSKFFQSSKTNPKTHMDPLRSLNQSQAMDLPELGLYGDTPSGEHRSSNSQGKSKSPGKSLASQPRATSKSMSPRQSTDVSPSPPATGRDERKGRPTVPQTSQNSIVLYRDHEGTVQSDATMQQKNTHPVSWQKRSTERLNDFKLPPSQAGRRGTPQRNRTPSGFYGDLEESIVQTTKDCLRSTIETQARLPSRPIPSPRQQGRPDRHHSRSLSRTSNISLKRSPARKYRTRTNPDRKKEAMNHVANS